MSTDLHVICRRQPKPVHLAEFLSATGAATADRPLRRDGSLLLADAAGGYVEVDGPFRIAPEDLPDAAHGAIARTGWLVQLSIKGAAATPWPAELAVHLARTAEGVVYDPQQDLVSWPHGWRPRDRTGGEEVTDELEFTWYVVPDTTAPDVPRRLVQSLRDHAPEALPKRYGGCEPLAHRFNDDAAFVEQWLHETTQGFGALFWTATPPSFGGSMFAHRTARCLRMGLSFDARPFYRDRAVTRRIVALFHSLAADLGCVYGAATVQRGVVIRRGRASSRFGKETGPLPRTTGWVGLPAAPTWIAWFGRPYAERVRASVAGHIAAASEVGILVQAGEDPMTADRLADVFPPLPAPLLARRGRRARWERGATFTWGFAPPSDPAQEIPPLD